MLAHEQHPGKVRANKRTGPGEKYLTAREAAVEIGDIRPATIMHWCRQGKLPGAFIISAAVGWRIPRSSWERFKKDHQASPAKEPETGGNVFVDDDSQSEA